MNPNDYKLTGTYYLDVTDMEKHEGKIPLDDRECALIENADRDHEHGYWVRVDVDDWKFVPDDTRF